MTDLEARSSINIKASPEEIWKAMTTPELIKQWFFGVDTYTDWQVGSPLVHRGVWQGKPYEDKGEILRIDPPKLLVHTHWSAVSGIPDRPENHEEITWELSDRDGATELTITEQNLSSEEARAVSVQGWKAALNNLKELLEK